MATYGRGRTTYMVTCDGCVPLYVTSKRGALKLGYEMAWKAFLGGTTLVRVLSDVPSMPIAKWVRNPGKKPKRVEV